MVEFLLFLIPSLIYVLVRRRSLGMRRAGGERGMAVGGAGAPQASQSLSSPYCWGWDMSEPD